MFGNCHSVLLLIDRSKVKCGGWLLKYHVFSISYRIILLGGILSCGFKFGYNAKRRGSLESLAFFGLPFFFGQNGFSAFIMVKLFLEEAVYYAVTDFVVGEV